MTPRAGWRPEYGWPWLLGRWAVAAGAAGVLAVAAAGGGGAAPRAELALDPTEIREVELDDAERAELDDLVPPADGTAATDQDPAGDGPGPTGPAPRQDGEDSDDDARTEGGAEEDGAEEEGAAEDGAGD